MKNNNIAKFFKFFILALLIAVIAASVISCDKNDDVVGTGEEITITVAVTNKAGETTETEIKTTATNLADALVGAGMVDGYVDTYGYTITAVNGEVADFNVDSAYWSLTKDGEYLMSGASSTTIADGEHYELTYTVY